VNANSLRHWGWRVNADRRRVETKATPLEVEALRWVEVAAPNGYQQPVAPTHDFATQRELADVVVQRAGSSPPTVFLTTFSTTGTEEASNKGAWGLRAESCTGTDGRGLRADLEWERLIRGAGVRA